MDFRTKRPARGSDPAGERGQALIMVAVLMAAVLGLSGLVFDYGKGAWEHRQAQNAADAAALAGAFAIYNGSSESTATTKANQIAQQDGFDVVDIPTITFFDSNGNQTSIPSSVQSVKAAVADSFATTPLMHAVGVSNITVYGKATAKMQTGGLGQCVLCLREPHNTGLNAGDGSTVTVGPGNIAVNSDCQTCAIVTSDSDSITAPQIGVVGGTSGSPQNFHPSPTTISPVPDPLINVPVPTCASGNPTGHPNISLSGSSSQTLGPGTYQNINLSDQAAVTLQPGVYCITGALNTVDTSSFSGSGVMLFFTCGSYPDAQACASGGQAGGSLTFKGQSVYNVTAPTSGTYQGLSLFYDRNNNSAITMNDAPTDTFSGTIYAKSSALNVWDRGTVSVDSLVVVNSLDLKESSLSVTDNPADNYPIPQIPVLSE